MIVDSKTVRQSIQVALSSQKQPTVTILSSLLAVQDEIGYLPDEAIEEVASFCHATINDVWGVASFYTNFRFTPPGRHVIEVCWGPPCHLKGATKLAQEVQKTLGISGEDDTKDKGFTLKYNTCLGACAQAPVISIDHHLIGRMNVEQARKCLANPDEIPT